MFNYHPRRDGADVTDMFAIAYKDIKFDRNLYKKLKRFRVDWARKSIEYSEFLGGNTLGLHPIRFSSRDDEMLMVDVYNIDHNSIYSAIINIAKITKEDDDLENFIDETWAVATNPMLQTLVYTMHRFIKDGKLGSKLDDALTECYYIFAYKVLGSLVSHYFPHNTTPALAKSTYERLSNRFLIKRLGTWNEVLDHRAKDILPKKGLHTDRLKKYNTDASVRTINDLQGRIRETIKNIYLVWLAVKEDGMGVKSTSLLSTAEGSDGSTKDLIDRPDKYVLRINELIGTPVNLIDSDLIYLVSQFIKASDADIIKATLLVLSEAHDARRSDNYLELLILKTIAYCNMKGISSGYRDSIVEVIRHMKGYWSSGSVNDKDVRVVKKYIEKAVKTATPRKTKWVIAANSLAVTVYLFVRSIK